MKAMSASWDAYDSSHGLQWRVCFFCTVFLDPGTPLIQFGSGFNWMYYIHWPKLAKVDNTKSMCVWFYITYYMSIGLYRHWVVYGVPTDAFVSADNMPLEDHNSQFRIVSFFMYFGVPRTSTCWISTFFVSGSHKLRRLSWNIHTHIANRALKWAGPHAHVSALLAIHVYVCIFYANLC
jgi:hypothetical protein